MEVRVIINQMLAEQEQQRRVDMMRRLPMSRDPMDVTRIARTSLRERIARDLVIVARWLAPGMSVENGSGARGAVRTTVRRDGRELSPCVPATAIRRP
ncbi:MAG: hypothetical protein H0U40_08115 [Chloroflexia bacterium]|nr:hypothetical protein [Chloroflexia bacterium]